MSSQRLGNTATLKASAPKAAVSFAIVLLAVALKLGFAAYLGGRVYPDVNRALNYAHLVQQGAFSIQTGVINDKTFVGPLLWLRLYEWAGVKGLLAFNVAAFVALCGVHYGLGRRRYDGWTRAIALALFAFYVGTNRNIVAGEPDDNLAALLVGVGLLIYLDTRLVLAAGLCIGAGFLFKFWVAIFGLGFACYLIWKRPWREFAWALCGMGAPFLALNGVDGMASFRALFVSLGIQHGYSPWGQLGSKLLSTGLLPCRARAPAHPPYLGDPCRLRRAHDQCDVPQSLSRYQACRADPERRRRAHDVPVELPDNGPHWTLGAFQVVLVALDASIAFLDDRRHDAHGRHGQDDAKHPERAAGQHDADDDHDGVHVHRVPHDERRHQDVVQQVRGHDGENGQPRHGQWGACRTGDGDERTHHGRDDHAGERHDRRGPGDDADDERVGNAEQCAERRGDERVDAGFHEQAA